jgi:uncharacterized membrane protein
MSNSDPSEIAFKTNEGRSKGRLFGLLRAMALIALVVGAVGSLGLMFREGQDTPRFLLVIFTIWVLAPFAALFWANKVSKRWSVPTRATLYCVILIVALGSLAIYGEWIDIKPAGSANAFLWVIVPPASLLFIAIAVGIAALLSSRLSRRGDGN